MMEDILVIPDVHGRSFWKDAVKCREDWKIVFLGDYLDPYKHENIGKEQAIGNFKEILAFKKEHMDNVHLLLGNHDCGYLDNEICTCRHDWDNEAWIRSQFESNIDLFDIDWYVENSTGGADVLFSHAGIGKSWLRRLLKHCREDEKPWDALNAMLHDESRRKELFVLLKRVSFFRGGYVPGGSIVWADVKEYELGYNQPLPDITQIIGHTQLELDPVKVAENVTCVDCRRGFILSSDGKLLEIQWQQQPIDRT